MTYPMWNEARTGILHVIDGNLTYLDSGPLYEELITSGVNPYKAISEPEPAPEVPSSVSPTQMRLALHRNDRLAQVQAIADADPEAEIVWEYALEIRRSSPLIDALKGSDFTDEEIDALFVEAAAIQSY